MAWRRRRMYVDDLPETHDARFLTIFLILFVAVLGAVYAVGYIVAGDKVPAGTSVADVRIGGMTRAEAADLLETKLSTQLDRQVTAVADGHRIRFTAADAGVTLDVEGTLDDAMDGTDWNPRHMLKVVEGGGRVDPVFHVDLHRLAAVLAPLAAKVDIPTKSSTVSILGVRAVVHAGQPGRRLVVANAADRLVAALDDDRPLVSLRLRSVPPAVGWTAATSFANQTVRPALRGPVVISVAGRTLKVTPAQFGPALRVYASDGGFRLGIAADELLRRTRGVLSAMPGRPLDASVVFRGNRPVVVPSRPGRTVDQAAWARAVLAATSSDSRRASAASRLVPPRFTTADARALNIRSQLGAASARAPTTGSAGLRVAALNLNATVVLPGANFSYAAAVGQERASTVLSPLGAATGSAAKRAGMTITQRPAATPFGRDLRFRNGSNYPIYIRSWVQTTRPATAIVVVQIWGSGA